MKFIRSIGYACNGLRHSIATQSNLRIHLVCASVVVLAGWKLSISVTEWLLVGICIPAVLMAELLNTAIEKLCDIVEPGKHEGIKLVKDIAAAAVLLITLGALSAGCFIFIPKFLVLVKSY